MDKPRNIAGRKRKIRILVGVSVVLVVGLVTTALSKLKPAAPTVDAGIPWKDTVKRGPMLRQHRGLGTLVPEEILWVPAVTDGRIEKRLVLPGTPVKADTVLMELRNPVLELSVVDAEMAWKSSEADYLALKARLDAVLLDQRSVAATVQGDYQQTKAQFDTDSELAKNGLLPELTLRMDKVKMEGAATRQQIEKERIKVSEESSVAQLAAQKARVEQLRANYQIRKNQLDALRVRAGADGLVQELLVQVGQQVAAGTTLAKVVQPAKLKAELKIAETQAKDILIGQKAEIDTRNGIIMGRVSRIDPSVINGTRTVDVRLEGKLPEGAVPDLSVDGTVEIERLADVLNVGRPVHGQANSTITLFKREDGDYFVRTRVKLGRTSVNTVEILEGLKVGDEVILSDMSAQDGVDRIRLK